MDFSIIQDIIGVVNGIKAGSVVSIGAALTVVIRLYRMIPKAPWPTEKWAWLVPLVTAVVGFLAALLTGVFGFGLAWPAALSAALGVAVNAAGFNSVTKAIGQALPNQNTVPEYKPSPFRKAATVLIPLPKLSITDKLPPVD